MSQDLLFWETSTCNSDGMNFGSLISEGKIAGWVMQGGLKRRIKEGRWEVSRDSFTFGGIWRLSHTIQHKFRETLISSHFSPLSLSEMNFRSKYLKRTICWLLLTSLICEDYTTRCWAMFWLSDTEHLCTISLLIFEFWLHKHAYTCPYVSSIDLKGLSLYWT